MRRSLFSRVVFFRQLFSALNICFAQMHNLNIREIRKYKVCVSRERAGLCLVTTRLPRLAYISSIVCLTSNSHTVNRLMDWDSTSGSRNERKNEMESWKKKLYAKTSSDGQHAHTHTEDTASCRQPKQVYKLPKRLGFSECFNISYFFLRRHQMGISTNENLNFAFLPFYSIVSPHSIRCIVFAFFRVRFHFVQLEFYVQFVNLFSFVWAASVCEWYVERICFRQAMDDTMTFAFGNSTPMEEIANWI